MSVPVRPGNGSEQVGRRRRQVTHAVLTGPWTLTCRGPRRGVTLHAGQAVCGELGPFEEPPGDLFGVPPVTCGGCYVACHAEGIQTWKAVARVIALVGCGALKLDRAAPARELYTGRYFHACLAAAEAITTPDRVYILSAKHGLIRPGDVTEPYDVRAGQPGAVTAVYVGWQAAVQFEIAREPVIALCGAAYADLAREVWGDVRAPLAGMGIGRQLQALAYMAISPQPILNETLPI